MINELCNIEYLWEDIIILRTIFLYIIVFAIATLIYILFYILSYYFMGHLGFLTAKQLTNYDIEKVKKGGISHYTTSIGYKGISNKFMIKGSKFTKAYSNHFKKCVFFFANEYKDENALKSNYNPKYSWKIDINNLSDKQIERLRIRDYDKALMYLGDLCIENGNDIIWTELTPKLNKLDKFLHMKKLLFSYRIDKYFLSILGCILISFTIVYGISITIILKFDLLQYLIKLV